MSRLPIDPPKSFSIDKKLRLIYTTYLNQDPAVGVHNYSELSLKAVPWLSNPNIPEVDFSVLVDKYPEYSKHKNKITHMLEVITDFNKAQSRYLQEQELLGLAQKELSSENKNQNFLQNRCSAHTESLKECEAKLSTLQLFVDQWVEHKRSESITIYDKIKNNVVATFYDVYENKLGTITAPSIPDSQLAGDRLGPTILSYFVRMKTSITHPNYQLIRIVSSRDSWIKYNMIADPQKPAAQRINLYFRLPFEVESAKQKNNHAIK